MKSLTRILAVAAGLAAFAACRPSATGELRTEIFNYEDSTAHADLSIEAELPLPGQGAAAEKIRAALVEVVDAQLSHIGTYEEERLFPAFQGSQKDNEAVVSYYRDKAMEAMGSMSQEDYDERVASLEENDGLTDAEREEFLTDMPGWAYSFSLLKTRETDRCVVFLSEDYVYLGGAHGGIIGRGGLTFDKQDGHLVETMLEPSSLDALQPLLRKGLLEYFSEEGEEIAPDELDGYLFIEGGTIPFPAWTPFPGEDGLVFVYQQYEIASYAAGMPNFTIAYDELLPFLTEEAKALLGL